MSRRTRVLFIWDVSERLKDYITQRLQDIPNVDLTFPSDVTDESLINLASGVDIIVGWRPTKELLDAATGLKLLINPGAGVQHILELFKESAAPRGVLLANCHGNSALVAQHATALLLALTNKTHLHHNWMASGEWRKGDESAKSLTLTGRQVGLLGYGAVNKKVHRFLSGFNLSFHILRRDWGGRSYRLPTPAEKYGHSELHRFLENIDIAVVAVPLTSLTRNMMLSKELELLGPAGLLVNISRGHVVNEKDLFEALKNEVIAGAAIDVWYDYDPQPDADGRKYPYNYPFHKLENVVLSPHRAASPFDDLPRWNEVIENIARFAKGKCPLNIVDLDREY